ncbi:D-alanyl-lipoteichoic acid biosynthesis protein DltD [Anaerosacchariphilus polymeriproducens]|uniref:D-alanyl-lipoteichoic acid biosynthesis protein DltD n=1 Tax=Anaerosacchariphilus polymeriproducens TaxID=1812858 RepID=A0A371AS15_9FIRM|nr:D-alanyl-lipoteichoic acid biosynthesis protein DltD [Anaerosacchariphilus polymeriproducens]RDU22270.1 D-alanyl-lipoteichoic acid biosynthesis protein DltD [Anaerosacchariphilus polymeriproducens]
MKKFIAFIAAFGLLIVTIIGCHFYLIHSKGMGDREFGLWTSEAKSKTLWGITRHLNKDSLVVFGSSEFQHATDTPYHPSKMFADSKIKPMLIGAGYYQSLCHAITLSAIEGGIQNRKAVLLVSPQWFRKTGVVDKAYASRFTELFFMDMLENSKLSKETKEYMISRTEELLHVDQATLKRVKSYSKEFEHCKLGFTESIFNKIYKIFLDEKDMFHMATQKIISGKNHRESKNGKDDKVIDWDANLKKAEQEGKLYNQNEFYMDDKCYNALKPFMSKKKNQSQGQVNGYGESPEYGDLRCFLDVCKEVGIEPMLVILPVNGYWYDYTAFPQEAREKFYENIRSIGKEYHANVADFSGEEYTKYFFEDGIHLGRKGWVMINESLFKFYEED